MFLTNKLNLIVTNNGKDYYELPVNSSIRLLSVEDFHDFNSETIHYNLNCIMNGGFIINCKRFSKESDLVVRNSGYSSVYLNDFLRVWSDVFKEEVPDILRVK